MANSSKQEREFNGIAASPGIAHGSVYLLSEMELNVPRYKVDASQRDAEVRRFDEALLVTRRQILDIQSKIRDNIGEDEARIFDAHLLVLEDQALIGEAIRELKATGENIENAVWEVGHRYIDAFSQIDDEYLRERASDIKDVLRRILSNLTGQDLEGLGHLEVPRVLVARDVVPSQTASVDKTKLLGFVTDVGSKTSHVVIVARSMNVPAVVGMGDFSKYIDHDDVVLIDGYDGKVVVNPGPKTLYKYGKLDKERKSFQERLIRLTNQPSVTRDGHAVKLMANIETADEAHQALKMGADGVGLFRSEYLFLNARKAPSEDEQYKLYSEAAETLEDRTLTIRTIDLGGDKMPTGPGVVIPPESNPFLGYRAIRFCLDFEELFLAQLRAILRASSRGNVRVMYPMISGRRELKEANRLLEIAKSQLRDKSIAFDEKIEAGAMIEIPSAAVACDTLVDDADFFSIGTNDLIQYMIAVDRMNDRVARLYDPLHPAVLRVLRTVLDTAKSGKIDSSVCGEIAGDPVLVPLLVGLGVDSFSMSSRALPEVKFVVQNMTMAEGRNLAAMALEETDSKVIMEKLIAFYNDRMSQLN